MKDSVVFPFAGTDTVHCLVDAFLSVPLWLSLSSLAVSGKLWLIITLLASVSALLIVVSAV